MTCRRYLLCALNGLLNALLAPLGVFFDLFGYLSLLQLRRDTREARAAERQMRLNPLDRGIKDDNHWM